MKHNEHFAFDHTEKTISIMKPFLKKAGIIGSEEYNTVLKLRKDYPDYKIVPREIKRKANKDNFKGLNYENMRELIKRLEEQDAAEAALERFENVIQMAKIFNGNSQYLVVRKWFLENYEQRITAEMKAAIAE